MSTTDCDAGGAPAEYEDWLKRRNDFLKQAELGLVDIYKTMKPDAAAGKARNGASRDRGGDRHAGCRTPVRR